MGRYGWRWGIAAVATVAAGLLWADGTFTNPVIQADWPDPVVIDGGDGTFYSVATGLRTVRSSKNLIDWTDTGIDPLTPEARKSLTAISGNIWAPCMVKLNGKWLIYVSLYLNDVDCRIEILSAGKPTGPFSYEREIINGPAVKIMNAIDPYVVKTDGRVWLFFGSCQDGVHRVELTADGLAIKPGATFSHVAGLRFDPSKKMWGLQGTWEGTYLLNRHGWWYLFVSGGKYNDHTYYLTVGRGKTIDGAFFDREGHSMREGLAKPILSSEKGDALYGPGHNGEVYTSADGRDWIFFHSHDTGFKPPERPTFLQELKWDAEGWPCFEGGKPQRTQPRFTLPKQP